ncbi:MAG TPA: transcription termination factor NusA [Armatimonadota bacterium]|nr:transcription termination factor NusA [Armatimonadota bacterium]
MQVDFVQALRDIGREKDIPLETLSEIIEAALVSAYKKHFGATGEIHVDIDWDNGTGAAFCRKQVVEHVENPHTEMSLAEARRLDPTVAEHEYLDIEVSPQEFGRIAAQTAKQVVAQRIREAERDIIYEEFSDRDGDVVTGVVQRRDGRTVFIDLGRVEAVLPASEQSPLDFYRMGERMKVYILEVKRTTKIPRVLVSRSHPGLLRKLFELEVPEVHEGIVEMKAQAREAGARSKVAVASNRENVDPVGACVGHRGSRVQAVVDELRGEKVDIVRWGDEAARYVASALSPAKVSRVIIDEATRSATVVAPDNQLSLAIGREGQNVRLAARLTGWRIDIRSEAQMAERAAAKALEDTEAAAVAEAGGDAPAEAALSAEPVETAEAGAEVSETPVAPSEAVAGEEGETASAEAEPEVEQAPVAEEEPASEEPAEGAEEIPEEAAEAPVAEEEPASEEPAEGAEEIPEEAAEAPVAEEEPASEEPAEGAEEIPEKAAEAPSAETVVLGEENPQPSGVE